MPKAPVVDFMKVSGKYKSEEIRFMTAEARTVKVWTYEIKDFELYLDTRVELKNGINSVAICESQ